MKQSIGELNQVSQDGINMCTKHFTKSTNTNAAIRVEKGNHSFLLLIWTQLQISISQALEKNPNTTIFAAISSISSNTCICY